MTLETGMSKAIEQLKSGEFVFNREPGNSMTPILKSREEVLLAPVLRELKKGDIVLCKVNGNTYTHKITGIRKDQVQISNNHGHINGWTSLDNIFGIVIQISGTPFKPNRNKALLDKWDEIEKNDVG